jgi:hypothetical protein
MIAWIRTHITKKLKIGTRMALGFSLVLAFLIAVSWVSVSHTAHAQKNLDLITQQSYEKIVASLEMRRILLDQSAFAPEALTIWPHLTASLLTKSANCGWLSAPGTAPWLARLLIRSG